MAGLQVDTDVLAGLAEANRDELELELAEACRRRAARERCAGWLARTGLS